LVTHRMELRMLQSRALILVGFISSTVYNLCGGNSLREWQVATIASAI